MKKAFEIFLGLNRIVFLVLCMFLRIRLLSNGPSSLLQEYVLFTFLFPSWVFFFFVYDKFSFSWFFMALVEMGFYGISFSCWCGVVCPYEYLDLLF